MLVLQTLWWLFFFSAVGLCIGSFLNVVIHRIPRNESVTSPLWSACPFCGHRIRWYDNVPVLSFICLRGQCRDCRASIATRYLVIELTMAIVVVLLLDAFFIGHIRLGLRDDLVGLTDQLFYDWPILLAHIILFACLLSMSAVDLEHYWVDVRFTNFATICGFVLHALWTPGYSRAWPRPWDTTATGSLLALAGLGLAWVVIICRPHMDPADFGEDEGADGESEEDEPAPGPMIPRLEPPRLGGWVISFLFVALLGSFVLPDAFDFDIPQAVRALVPLFFLFAMIVSASWTERVADREIIEAIEEERDSARRMVMMEGLALTPAVILGIVGIYLARGDGAIAVRIHEAFAADVAVPGVAFLRNWSPLQGLATAATGYVVAGAIGWTVRIVFTLIFGREAFGSGDIHLMAAAGCVAGWPVVVLGFFLCCGLALTGVLISLPKKRSRAIPLGPWLSLSFLVVVIFYDRILAWPYFTRLIDTVNVLFLGNSQL